MVSKNQLDDPYFNPLLHPKTIQFIKEKRLLSEQQPTNKQRNDILKAFGIARNDNGLQLIKTLKRPSQVK